MTPDLDHVSDQESAELLDAWSERIAAACSQSVATRSNEAGLIADVDHLIRQALSEVYGFDQGAFEAEFNTTQGDGHSPVDRTYGSVAVEYEWMMGAARRNHGADQALGYLANMERTAEAHGQFTAAVTDGREWGFLVDRPTDTPELFTDMDRKPDSYFEWRANSPASCRRFLRLCGSHRQSPVNGRALANEFGPTNVAVQNFVALLSDLIQGRSPDDRTDTLLKEWARSTEVVYGSLDTLSAELGNSLRSEFNVPSGNCAHLSELLFLVHTYFALVARLVAVEVMAIALQQPSSEPSHWVSLSDPELIAALRQFDAGLIPEGLEVHNLFEADVFSWWVDHLDMELLAALRHVLEVLGMFAFPRVAFGAAPATDNLRELYQRLIPRELRKQLGEYPTPFWLAEASLIRLEESGAPVSTGRVLDPCCGTGAFLLPILRSRVAALRQKRGDSVTPEDVQSLLDGLAGFDINPIAVTATRANFIVALGSLAEVGRFSLPIWRTDSIVVPDLTPAQGVMDEPRLAAHGVQNVLELRTSLPDSFPIPASFKSALHMAAVRHALEATVDTADAVLGRSEFLSEMSALFGPTGSSPSRLDPTQWPDTIAILEVLWDRIRKLHDEGRDGIWARVIENAFAPILIGEFDVVVGNPPWLAWPKLPERWRSSAGPLWKRYGLWNVPLSPGERRKRFAQFNDIAVLVFATALGRYARKDGWVGFLVPDILVMGDPGARAFRKFHLSSDADDADQDTTDVNFRIVSSDQWGEVGPFGADAANRPIFLVAHRDVVHSFPVPTVRWRRKEFRGRLDQHWQVVQHQLATTAGQSYPVDRSVSFAAWSFVPDGVTLLEGGSNSWAFGMGVNTRGANGVLYVDLLETARSDGLIKIRNLPSEGRNRNVAAHTSRVEAGLVYPLLRGADIRAWSATPSGYVLITQDPEHFNELLSEDSLRDRFPNALNWLRKHRAVLGSRSVPNQSWDIGGRHWYRLEGPFDHIIGKYLVVLPEQRLPPPAAICFAEVTDPLLRRKAPPMPNQKVVFCAVDTLDEAIYLTACINSSQVQELLRSFASGTAVSPMALARLPLPKYDPDADAIQSLIELGYEIQQSLDRGAAAVARRGAMDLLVEDLLVAQGASSESAAPVPAATAKALAAPRRLPSPIIPELFDALDPTE